MTDVRPEAHFKIFSPTLELIWAKRDERTAKLKEEKKIAKQEKLEEKRRSRSEGPLKVEISKSKYSVDSE